jgi:PD-(D/E)XK endonuclease
MGGTLTGKLRVKGKSRPRTDLFQAVKTVVGMHNPKVSGSNPLPATILKPWILLNLGLQDFLNGGEELDTKLRGDIAEQAAVLYALKREWGVLQPVGDRLPYDLVFDVAGSLIRIQVKSAWLDEPSGNYVVDNRRTKTNRRVMLRDVYQLTDFDFALAYIEPLDLFYVFPVDIFVSYGSEIHLVEAEKRQRKPRSIEYRDAWNLMLCSTTLLAEPNRE